MKYDAARAETIGGESHALMHNYWLRILLCVAMLAITALAGALAYTVHENAHRQVPVVRVDGVGRAEVFAAADYDYKPRENEVNYFLGRWITLRYSRRRATLKEDQIAQWKFLDKELFERERNRENREHWIEEYMSSGEPEVIVTIRSVVLPPQWATRKPPYSVVVEFDEVKMQAGNEIGRDTVYATATFIADPSLVDDSRRMVNPLGFAITEVQEGRTLVPVE